MTITRAMRLSGSRRGLVCEHVMLPKPREEELLLRVLACGVCRTDLHLLDGELAHVRYPVTPGHEIVGRVVERGARVTGWPTGSRVGVPWLGWTCGVCSLCTRGQENLCPNAQFTGATRDGGYADHVIVDSRYCLSIPESYSDVEAAPLLCAGLIGYRAYRAAGEGHSLGLYGFGAAAHLLAQLAVAEGRDVYAFTRPGDGASQAFARELGVAWAGSSDQAPPVPLDAAILFAPVGALAPLALAAVGPGGRVVCAGIHMSDIPGFPYSLLWGERTLCSVANLTRRDGEEFMRRASAVRLRPVVRSLPLDAASEALEQLRGGQVQGALVLRT